MLNQNFILSQLEAITLQNIILCIKLYASSG